MIETSQVGFVFERIADLTWKHPKIVLAAVGVFTLLAVAVGHDVEQHLKAAGFTDIVLGASGRTALLRDALGYDPNPGARGGRPPPDGGRLDLADPQTGPRSRELKGRVLGREIDPLGNANGAAPVAATGARSCSSANISSRGHRGRRRRRRRRGQTKITLASSLDVGDRRLRAGFNEVNDQTRTDLTKAELIAFPILALICCCSSSAASSPPRSRC